MVFIDLQKMYDRVPHKVIQECLKKKEVLLAYIRAIKDMYEGVKNQYQSSTGNAEYFPIDIRHHQDLALSSFLFTIVMDELTREIQDEILWCMLFADDCSYW